MSFKRWWVTVALVVLVLALTLQQTVKAHGDDDDDDDDGMGMKTTPTEQAEEAKKKRQLMLLFHAVLASIIVWITMPLSIAFVAGKKIDQHRTMSSINTLGLSFVGIIAAIGFANGQSMHAKIAFTCLGAWVSQAMYGWIRHYFFKATMSIKPHRFFGIVLFALSIITWASGVLHVMGSCNALSDVQMCNAHFYLGALFVIVGQVNAYYAPEYAAKVEMCLIALGGLSELFGEGAVDSILNAIDPVTFKWDSMAKIIHLTTATVWVLCAFLGWVLAIRRPTSLQRGWALTLGCLFHLIFMFIHGSEASPKTQAAHLLHELALIPVLIARPMAMFPKLTSYLLTVSGFAFIWAADPITRDVKSIDPFPYVIIIILCASIFHAVHGYIRQFILKKEPSETMLERTGWAQPIWCVLGCFGRLFCCCPGLTVEGGELTKVADGSKYSTLQANAPNGVMEEESKVDIDEDVTSAPHV